MSRGCTIVAVPEGGRLGNQLVSFANILAWLLAAKTTCRLLFLPMLPYLSVFQGPGLWALEIDRGRIRRSIAPEFVGALLTGPRSRAIEGLIRQTLRTVISPLGLGLARVLRANVAVLPCHMRDRSSCAPNDALDLAQIDSDVLYSARIVLLHGWPRDRLMHHWSAVEEHWDVVRAVTRFKSVHVEQASRCLGTLRKRYDRVVGVHIRQTDYQSWKDGKYYFLVEEYLGWMSEVFKQYRGRGERACFLLTSDEILRLDRTWGVPVFLSRGTRGGPGHYIDAMLELAACDLIMAPPSTFSAWASMLGGAPLLVLRSASMTAELDNALLRGLGGLRSDPDMGRALFV